MPRFNFYVRLVGIMLPLLVLSCQQGTKIATSQSKYQLPNSANTTLLKEYTAKRDAAYEYKVVNVIKGEGYSTFIIKLISQKWLSDKEVKDPIWWHWLTVVVPDGVEVNTAMLVIGGGNRKSPIPTKHDDMALQLALGSQSIVANLHNVPNQPMEFVNDDYGPRVEDELIAYGWKQFLDGGSKDADATWLARFPMTNAAVRAMDALVDFTSKKDIPTIEKFVVTGASKRGWTTWTTAIVDDRVVAIIPIVIDMLNAIPSFQHHWQVYGKWAAAIGDYEKMGIMEWQNSKEYARLMEITEPYTYKDELTLPKLLLNATGDQFFIPDSWQFYWNDLKGEKHLRYVPNSEHSMGGTDVLETVGSFYQMILAKQERPTFDWSVKNGTVHIQTHPKFQPTSITLWQAHNPKARNFQVDEIGRTYQASEVPTTADGQYAISIPSPSKGYAAFYVELSFSGLGTLPLKLSTGVVVTPDTYPFEPFKPLKPMGKE